MSRTFAPKSFLRHTSNALLQRYFHERGLLADLEIAALGETDIKPVFEAYQALSDDVRTQVDADFSGVDRLAHAQGEQTILDEARFHRLDLVDDFAGLHGFHDRSLLTFIDHREVFDVASLFNDADLLSRRYWLVATSVPRIVPADDDESCDRLGGAIGRYLRAAEGRGEPCKVEVYLRVNRHYYFAYPQDYGATHMEYVADKLERRQLRPAFEIIFCYAKDEGTLDVYFDGSRKRAAELREIFSREILRQDFATLQGERIFDLNRLKQRGFEFTYGTDSGIVDVRIKKLRCQTIGMKERLTLEPDPGAGRVGIYDQLDRVFQTDRGATTSQSDKLPLSLVNITQAGLTVEFRRTAGRGRPTRSFGLSYPNACSLNHDGRDGIIRQMLIASGIERRPLVQPAA